MLRGSRPDLTYRGAVLVSFTDPQSTKQKLFYGVAVGNKEDTSNPQGLEMLRQKVLQDLAVQIAATLP